MVLKSSNLFHYLFYFILFYFIIFVFIDPCIFLMFLIIFYFFKHIKHILFCILTLTIPEPEMLASLILIPFKIFFMCKVLSSAFIPYVFCEF